MLSNQDTIRAEFGDCDPSGIVFNPHFFRWFDASVHALLRAGGTSLKALQEKYGIVGIPLVESHIQFFHPVYAYDLIEIQTRVNAVHRCVFDLEHLVSKKEALTAVKASETRAWTVLDTAEHRVRAAPLPSWVRQLLIDGQARMKQDFP
ncbi:MAG: acyl-CoA thioesterase [Desulfovermiculus sp.]